MTGTEYQQGDAMIELALAGVERVTLIVADLRVSVNKFSSSYFSPRARHMLVSIMRRYMKQKNIKSWKQLEISLPEEYARFIKKFKVCYKHLYYDPAITWDAFESLIEKYLPGALKLSQFFRNTMKNFELPFSS
jgi:hypothetical protein